jgi:hypothetical protein
MPLAPVAQIQTDYNTGKAAKAALQTAVDAAAAAWLTLEQACQALEADGASDIAAVLRAQAITSTEGYQVFGNGGSIAIYPRNPSVARDLSAVNSVPPVTATATFQRGGLTP